MKQFCQKRLTEVFRNEQLPLATERLRQELAVIQSFNQTGSIEEASEAIQHLKEQSISCRLIGAGCSSLVSYLLGFSPIDPSEHGLPYERFLCASSQRMIQFSFLAFSHNKRSKEEFAAILDEACCDLVTFQAETSLASIPSFVAQAIHRTDPDFSLTSIPMNDDPTFELLQSGDVEGISQIYGHFSRRQLLDMNVRSLTDIAAMGALQISEMNVPGIWKKCNRRTILQQHESRQHLPIAEILEETRGMILFQEQIMLIMNRVADIPFDEGYAFIKAACKRRWEQVAFFREWFVAQLLRDGAEEDSAINLFQQLLDASITAGCKSHYLSEALVTYRAAYLKTHFPKEFSCTLQLI